MPTTDKVSILAELFLIDNPYTSLKDLYNPSTAQGRSLLWITKEDKITLSHVTKAMQNEGALVNNLSIQVRNQIRQRFILVALDLALHRPPSSSSSSSLLANLTTTTAENKVLQPEIDTDVWNDDGVSLLQEDAILTPALSFPNQHECKWTGIICSDDAVEQIIWARRNLSGRLVPELALLESLTHVDLAQNNIEDNLDVFWRLPRLKTLYLFDNAFQGSIAEDIAKMSLLENLYLGHNRLTGTLPPTIFQNNLRRLRYLNVNYNNLSGTLPSLIRLPSMFYFDLSHNNLRGVLPSDIDMFVLKHFHLDSNQFSGSIPNSYPRMGNMRFMQLTLNDNRLTGTFPPGPWHRDFPHRFLTNVDISNNRMQGSIPSSVCQLSVFEEGETVEFRADCNICTCSRFCRPWCE